MKMVEIVKLLRHLGIMGDRACYSVIANMGIDRVIDEVTHWYLLKH